MRPYNCLLIFLFTSFVASAQTKSELSLEQKARLLRVFLEKNHYQPLVWNDTASIRLFNRWMEILDDDKQLFIQPEITELEKFKTSLDEEITGTGWNFFSKSLQLYKSALHRSDSLRKLMLSKPLDFSKPDMVRYPFTTYASSVTELQQRITKLDKWRILRSIFVQIDTNENKKTDLSKPPADFAAREIKAREKLKKQQEVLERSGSANMEELFRNMEDKYLQAISWCYDPHTQYMNLQEKKGFETELSGFEYSTGMSIRQNEDGNYEIERLEPGGSAWRSSELHKGDIVLSIKKGNSAEKELAEMDEDEVNELLKGSSDEKVEITVRSTAGASKKVILTKEKVTNDEGIVKSYVIHGAKNIGYIQLPDFYTRDTYDDDEDDRSSDGCANDVSKEIVKLKNDTIAGLILDLRSNGGGSMWEAMQLAGIFIDYGPVGSVKDKKGKVTFLKDPNRGTAYDGPLLVLVNSMSASASELTSAMLQDYKRALIVGSTTYGKGSAQDIIPMDTGYVADTKKDYASYKDFVKVTEEKFYRIDGTTTQWKGVEPDIRLPDIYEGAGYRESKNASALMPDNSKKGIYQPLSGIPYDLLKEKSNSRINADSSFAAVKKATSWVKEYYTGRDIPLQWQTYAAFYTRSKEMYSLVEEASDSRKNVLSVSNNNFDQEKIKFATPSGKELNDAYMKHIAGDLYISEACKIFNDWLGK